jgi:ADP-L-glycero-D-manno-heptose 6-epimerase
MIVITGGAGFIGSCILKKFNENGKSNIIVVDRMGTEDKWKNLVGKKFHRLFHKNEFLEKIRFDTDLRNSISTIIHMGACSTTTETNVDYIMSNNLNYSIELARFAAENDVRFIYASSAATYGDGSNGYNDALFDDLRPLNPYGLSKHLFDLWLIDNRLDKEFIGLKFFNVFGPNEYHKDDMASMVYRSFNQIIETGEVKLYKSNALEFGDGGQKRDFIYVKDVVNVIWKLQETEKYAGIYNMGTGKPRSWNDLVNAVFSSMGKESNINYIDMPDNLINQYQNFTQAQMEKFEANLFPMNFGTLEDSIDDYVKNYLMKTWKHL